MNKFIPLDPISGPLSKDELKALVDAPYGLATKIIRRHDPLYGRAPGEKIRWKVCLEGHMQGTAYVEAATEKEASELADKINEASVNWDYTDDLDVLSVEPVCDQRLEQQVSRELEKRDRS